MEFLVKSERETGRLAKALLERLLKRKGGPIIFALQGDLGTGKTVFAKAIARALGITENVESPTFVIAKWYRLKPQSHFFRHFIHIDLYRLDTRRDIQSLGLQAILRNQEAIFVIEWADRVKSSIPKHALWVSLEHVKGNQRRIRTNP